MILPQQMETVRAADRSGLLLWNGTPVGPEIPKGSYNVFDGTNYKLNIKVTPTYLYSLSDNDEQTLLIVDVD
jgi:hypothetical protein